MSTYSRYGESINIENFECPSYVFDFLRHCLIGKNLSKNTLTNYYVTLLSFLRYIQGRAQKIEVTKDNITNIDVSELPFKVVSQITSNDVKEYIYFAANTLENKPSSRQQKLTIISIFYEYLVDNELIDY